MDLFRRSRGLSITFSNLQGAQVGGGKARANWMCRGWRSPCYLLYLHA